MAKLDFILADTTAQAMNHGLDFVMEKSNKDKFSNFVIILPEDKTILAENYLLKISPNGAFSNIYIFTFKRLLSKISQINSSRVLSKQASVMVVRKIVMDNLDKLVCYKKTANTAGFAQVMFETISQLKSSNVSVADFYEMIEGVNSSTRIKLQDIALIYEKYQEYIENNYIDQSDLLTTLGGAIETSNFVKNAHFFYFGFDSVTNEALLVCEKLVQSAKSFIVSAPYKYGEANDHISDNEVFTKFKNIADKLNQNYNPIRLKTSYKSDFAHIKQNLFAYPQKQTKPQGCVEVLSATSAEDEVKFIAEKIQNLIKSGAKYSDFAVIAPNFEVYEQYIDKVFAENKFSYFVSKPYDFALHPLFGLIKNLLEIVRKNFEKSSVINFLSNALLSINCLDEFINYVEQYGIKHNKFRKSFEKFDEKIYDEQTFKQIENVRQFVVESALVFENNKTISDYNNSIKKFLQQIQIEQKLEDLSQNQEAVYSNLTKQALNKLEETIKQMDMFLGAENISLDTYQNILLAGLDVSDISLIPISQDAITVLKDADSADSCKYLFVLGALDGIFPARKDDCGIILDNEINELNERSHKTIEPTIKTINRREKYKAYETMLLPTEKIFLSYSLGSGENTGKPSIIIKQLINMFGEDNLLIQKYLGEFAFDKQNYKRDISSKINSLEKAEKFLCNQIGIFKTYGNFEDKNLTFAIYNEISKQNNNDIGKILQNINKNINYTIKNADKLYFTNNKISTSQLEKYFTCPFLFFTNYGLRLKENQTSSMKSLDIGNILHKVAEIFIKTLCKNKNIDVKNTAKNIIKHILDNQYNIDDNKLLSQIMFDESMRLCEKLAEEIAHSKYKPSVDSLEWSFDNKNAVPLTDRISLEGKIDRIDRFGNKFRIIDYKTGKIEDNLKMVYYGKKIQLVTYLLAMKNSGLEPACVVYFPIRNEYADDSKLTGRMKGFYLNDIETIKDMDTTLGENNLVSKYLNVRLTNSKKDGLKIYNRGNVYLSKQDFDALCEYTIKLSQTAIAEILSGYAMPSPIKLTDSGKPYCENCAFYGICGVEKTKYANGRKCFGSVDTNIISRSEV